MYVTLNQTTYWYELIGEGVPVVMLHGFTGTSHTWKELVNDWLSDFQSLIIDLPGHGRTDAEGSVTMEDFCRDLDAMCDYLQLNTVHLIGYSMGGRAALSFAMTYPERVKSLTLESASPGLEEMQQRAERQTADEKLAERIETDGIDAFVNEWGKLPLFKTQLNLPNSVQRQIREERLSQSVKGLTQSLRYMGTGSQRSWWDELPGLYVPVLLLTGGFDDKFINISQRMKKKLPMGREITVLEAGHAIHIEQPEKFGKIVYDFLTHKEDYKEDK